MNVSSIPVLSAQESFEGNDSRTIWNADNVALVQRGTNDVLGFIGRYLTVNDCARLARCCRHLRDRLPTIYLQNTLNFTHLVKRESLSEMPASYQAVIDTNRERLRYRRLCGRFASDAALAQTVSKYPHLETLEIVHGTHLTDSGFAAITQLSMLRTLVLTGCHHLTKEAFKCLKRLPCLEKVKVIYCSINDASVAELAQIPKLQSFSVRESLNISDVGLLSLRQRSSTLEELAVVNCPFVRGAFLKIIPDLHHLVVLNLRGSSKIERGFFQHVAAHPFLQYVDLTGCHNVDSTAVAHIALCPQLNTLILDYCSEVDDTALLHLSQNRSLYRLSLQSCKAITQAGCWSLAQCSRLGELDLSGCGKINDDAIGNLLPLQDLRVLKLASCPQLTNRALCCIRGFVNLRELSLARCSGMTPEGQALEPLTELSHLQNLNIGYCGFTAAQCEVLGKVPALRQVSLRKLPVTSYTISCLSSQIEVLDLQECERLDDTVFTVLSIWSHLHSLNLRHCPKVTKAGVTQLRHFSRLESLNLGNCFQLGDDAMDEIAKVQTLRQLFIGYCYSVTDRGLQPLRALRDLRQLELAGLSHVSDEGCSSLAEMLRRLQELRLEDCIHVSDTVTRSLVRHPALEHVETHGTHITHLGIQELSGLTLRAMTPSPTGF